MSAEIILETEKLYFRQHVQEDIDDYCAMEMKLLDLTTLKELSNLKLFKTKIFPKLAPDEHRTFYPLLY